MENVKLIIVAGMSGTGKSTTAQNISYQYMKNGVKHEWYHEEMQDHPIRWANGGEFTVGDLKTEEGMRSNVLDTYARWQLLVEDMLSKGGIFVMEGCLYQNIIRYFIPGAYPVEKITEYYDELVKILMPVNPHIIHLHRPDVAKSFEKAFAVRGKKWEHIITDGKSEYEFSDEAAYQAIARSIFDRFSGKKLSIDTSDDNWGEYRKEICNFLNIRYYERRFSSVQNPEMYAGHFECANGERIESINIICENGELFLSPSWFTHIKLNAIVEHYFEASAFPIYFTYSFADNEAYIKVSGNYDWSIVGKTLKRI